jgi:hypothetical protein
MIFFSKEPKKYPLGLGGWEWSVNGIPHREGQPARIWADGREDWFESGKRHRLDGPAVTEADGTRHWWFNDVRHRIDGPAIIRPDGTEEWYLDGLSDRVGGPAVNSKDGRREWIVRGRHHRTDGPAREFASGAEGEWWLHDNRILTREDAIGLACESYPGHEHETSLLVWLIHNEVNLEAFNASFPV